MAAIPIKRGKLVKNPQPIPSDHPSFLESYSFNGDEVFVFKGVTVPVDEVDFQLCQIHIPQNVKYLDFQYTVDAAGKVTIAPGALETQFPDDCFAYLALDVRPSGPSEFYPLNATYHICQLLGGNLNGSVHGCGTITGGGKFGDGTYQFPIFTVAPPAAGDQDEFTNRNLLFSGINIRVKEKNAAGDRRVDNLEISIETRNQAGAFKIEGLTSVIPDHYLIPFIMPEQFIAYYAVPKNAEGIKIIEEWLAKVLNYTSQNQNQTPLVVAVNTPLFREDELGIFITFNASLIP